VRHFLPIKKRAFDLTITFLSAMLWVPAIIVCALLILVTEGKPIFYVSKRRLAAGVDDVPKFRTMIKNADLTFNRDTVPVSNNIRFLNTPIDSPLYTPVGRLIERCALTELPQLVLVIRGKMSLVGNRPLPTNVISSLAEIFPAIDDRFLMPAGLTGPVQLIGRTEISDVARLELEATYCRATLHHYSLRLDFLILLYTVLVASGVKSSFTESQVHDLIGQYTRTNTS